MSEKIINGYSGIDSPEDGFKIPEMGIVDIDRAIFNLFDKRLKFQLKIDGEMSSVPVVFASGERFALTRRNKPIRDVSNALILPIISIKRGNLDFSPGQEGYGTPIAPRDQPSYTIKRRLSKK